MHIPKAKKIDFLVGWRAIEYYLSFPNSVPLSHFETPYHPVIPLSQHFPHGTKLMLLEGILPLLWSKYLCPHKIHVET